MFIKWKPGRQKVNVVADLARWLVAPDNPLVWRSIVNRVWQHHFGEGLVSTPNDFGRMGSEPSHPELLGLVNGTFPARRPVPEIASPFDRQ